MPPGAISPVYSIGWPGTIKSRRVDNQFHKQEINYQHAQPRSLRIILSWRGEKLDRFGTVARYLLF
jgi:hypothetical protein